MLELKIDAKSFVGWDEVRILRSVDNAVSVFSFTATQHPDNIQPLETGGACEIIFNGEKLITGIIDRVGINYDKNQHIFKIDGRSKTKDLVDCSVVAPFQFSKMSVKRIATELGKLYNIIVSGGDDKTIINNFQIEQNGETCFDAIQRISETKAFRITDNPAGELLLTQTGKTKTPNIIDGTSVLKANLVLDESQQYSKITVKGQGRSTDASYGKKQAQIIGSATDETIERKRELIIRAENDATTEDVKKLAAWEVSSRAARGFQLAYTLQGWTGSGNALWMENELVTVRDKILGINDDYLIVSVEYVLNSSGSIVNLGLADPDSYLPQPVITKKPKTVLTPKKLWSQKGGDL